MNEIRDNPLPLEKTDLGEEHAWPEVEEARAKLSSELVKMGAKKKDLLLELFREVAKKVSDPESTCEETKNLLHDLISRGLISTRDIERYCPSEWKNKKKSRAGRAGALSKSADKLSAEKEQIPERPAVVVLTGGANQEYRIETDSEPRLQGDMHTSDPRITNSHTSDPRITNREQIATTNVLKFEFSIPLGDVRKEIRSKFGPAGDSTPIWFHGSIDLNTGKVSAAALGLAEDSDINAEKWK